MDEHTLHYGFRQFLHNPLIKIDKICQSTRSTSKCTSLRRLEKGHVQPPVVALEAVAQGCQSTIGVHPLAQVTENLLAGFCSV
jgi:hypothetical protein